MREVDDGEKNRKNRGNKEKGHNVRNSGLALPVERPNADQLESGPAMLITKL